MTKLSYNRKEAAEYLGISLYKLDEHKRLGHICPRYDGSVPAVPQGRTRCILRIPAI